MQLIILIALTHALIFLSRVSLARY